MVTRTRSLKEILHVIVQRRWLILVPFAIGAAAAPLLARYAPLRYRSEALILVLPQLIPDSYVKATVNQTVAERLPALTDQIKSRSRLEQIIREMDLYKRERSRDVMENVVLRMRDDIATTVAGKEVDSFRVSYVSDNAETARKVTARLVSDYVNQNVTDRQKVSEGTSVFLETQLAEAKRQLIEQERKLEEYRKSHAGQLPTQLQGNLQVIQNANLQLQSLNESTNSAQLRKLLFERQIADIEAVPLPAPPDPTPRVGPDQSVLGSTAQQLELARARLAAALQRYTPDHPEVISLERQVADLVAKREGETPLGPAEEAPEKPVTAADAAQRKKILDLQAELAVIDHQVTSNATEAASLKQTIADYQAKVDAVPTRESELVDLTRDYSTMQAAYGSLLMKEGDSKIAANLERQQSGEQFQLVDEASLPGQPFNQRQRLAIMASGSLVGLALGLLIVVGLEYRDSSFRDENEVLKALSVPVLALIPLMRSDRERRVVKWRHRAVDVCGLSVLLAAGAVLVVWRLRM